MKTNSLSNGVVEIRAVPPSLIQPPSPRASPDGQHGVEEQAHGHAGVQNDNPAILSPDVHRAARQAMSEERWQEADKHFADLDQAIAALPDASVRTELHEASANCRGRLGRLRSDLQAFVEADRPGANPAELYVGSVRLVQDCRAVVGALTDVRDQAAQHAGKTNIVKAIALAVAGLVLLGGIATLAVVFAPVVVPGLALTGLIVLGVGGGASAMAALTMLCLAIREMVAKPAAYRNLPKTNPELVGELQALDAALTAWVAASESDVGSVRAGIGGGLPDGAYGEGGPQAFLEQVRMSDLPAHIKDAIRRMHGGNDGDEPLPESSALRSSMRTDIELAASAGIAPVFAAAKAAAVSRLNVGEAKELRSVVTIRVWPEDLKKGRLGHAAASTDLPGGEEYHSFWPEERSTNPLRRHRGVAQDQCYRRDKVDALNPETRRALERGEFTPRGLQKQVLTDGPTTWGLPANKVYLPVFGMNAMRETGEARPCLFGLGANAMRKVWTAVAEGGAGEGKPVFKAFSKTRNCAGMILHVMAAGGAAAFVDAPKFRFFARPSAVLQYAVEVEKKIATLNKKADVLIQHGHHVHGIGPDISLEEAWANYKEALVKRGGDTSAALAGSSAGANLATLFTDEEVLGKNPFTLMKMAKLLLDEDDRNQKEKNAQLMLANEKQCVPLALLCALRSAMCEPEAAGRAVSLASDSSYQSIYVNDDAEDPFEAAPQDDVADIDDIGSAVEQADSDGEYAAVPEASGDAVARHTLPPPALDLGNPAVVAGAWRETIAWTRQMLDAAQVYLDLLSPMNPNAIPLPASDAVAEDNLAARYALLDRMLPPLLVLTALADTRSEEFPRNEALTGLAWEMTKLHKLETRPANALTMAEKGHFSIPLQALPPQLQDAAATEWRAVIEKARRLEAALSSLCAQLRDPSLNASEMRQRLADGAVVRQKMKLEKQIGAVRQRDGAASDSAS